MKNDTTGRLKVIDYEKAVFIFFVIILHAEVMDACGPLFLLTIEQSVPCFILLSGYTFTLTSASKSLRQMYNLKDMLRKFLRFTIPTVITYMIYLAGWFVRGEYRLTFREIIGRFTMGLYGPGGYYYGIMLQFLLLAPVMLYMVRRYAFRSVILTGIITLLYEILCSVFGIDENIYRVLIFRYLLFLVLGMWMYYRRNIAGAEPFWQYLSALIGIIYLLMPVYGGYEYRLFTRWSGTSMMTAFYVYPVLYTLLCRYGDMEMRGKTGSLMELIGRASYHVMYAQLIYFVGIKAVIYSVYDISQLGKGAEVMAALLLSISGGIVFYFLDNRIFGRLYRKRTA